MLVESIINYLAESSAFVQVVKVGCEEVSVLGKWDLHVDHLVKQTGQDLFCVFRGFLIKHQINDFVGSFGHRHLFAVIDAALNYVSHAHIVVNCIIIS